MIGLIHSTNDGLVALLLPIHDERVKEKRKIHVQFCKKIYLLEYGISDILPVSIKIFLAFCLSKRFFVSVKFVFFCICCLVRRDTVRMLIIIVIHKIYIDNENT